MIPHLEELRIVSDRGNPSRLAQPRNGRPRPAPGELFLCGPIPWLWVTRAGRLPGRALQVGLVIWHYTALRRTGTVKLNLNTIAREFQIDRSTASRGLDRLEEDGLIVVERGAGRCAVVTLLPVVPGDGEW